MNRLNKGLQLPLNGRLMNLRAVFLLFAVAFIAPNAQAQNPASLLGRVNALEDAVSALQATVSALQSNIGTLQTSVAKLNGQITANDLVGTYAFHGFQVELSAGNSALRPNQVSSYVFLGTLTLNANGTASISSDSPNGNTLALIPLRLSSRLRCLLSRAAGAEVGPEHGRTSMALSFLEEGPHR